MFFHVTFSGKIAPKRTKKLIIWRNKMHARVQGRVELKDSVSPNWFGGIRTLDPI